MTDVQWTADGQVLTVAEETGQLHLMLAALPVVNATFGSRVAYLTSLLEMSIADVILGWRVYVQLEAEPSVVALTLGWAPRRDWPVARWRPRPCR